MPNSTKIFINLAGLVIILAGLKASAGIVLPVLLALFICVLSIPLLLWFQRKNCPSYVAILAITLIIIGIGLIITSIVGTTATAITQNIPEYEEILTQKMSLFGEWLGTKGIETKTLKLEEHLNPSVIFTFVAKGLDQITSLLTYSVLILLLVIFILLESALMQEKYLYFAKKNKKIIKPVNSIIERINQYMGIKIAISFLTGVIIAIGLTFMGIHYPLLWGFLAFLLNFVPSVGSIIAAVPVIALGLVLGGISKAVSVFLLFLCVNIILGNLMEPRILGRGLGLSPLFVIFSLLFWGWLFGPIGVLLSIPLTMIFKISLDGTGEHQWLTILMDSRASFHEKT